jgi:hypothetical protein
VLSLDKNTVLCDSRISCAEYSDQIIGWSSEDPAGRFGFELNPYGYQATASWPYSLHNLRDDVYVRTVLTFDTSADLGWYKFIGGKAGTGFYAEYSEAQCMEGQPHDFPKASATYVIDTTFPSLWHGCQGGEMRYGRTFGEPFKVAGSFSVTYTADLIEPSGVCMKCNEESLMSGSRFTGKGFLDDGSVMQGIQIVPADVPEPSTYAMLCSGLVIGLFRQRRRWL